MQQSIPIIRCDQCGRVDPLPSVASGDSPDRRVAGDVFRKSGTVPNAGHPLPSPKWGRQTTLGFISSEAPTNHGTSRGGAHRTGARAGPRSIPASLLALREAAIPHERDLCPRCLAPPAVRFRHKKRATCHPRARRRLKKTLAFLTKIAIIFVPPFPKIVPSTREGVNQ